MPDITVSTDIDSFMQSANNAAARANLGAQAALTTAAPLALNLGGTGAITASAALSALGAQPVITSASPIGISQGGTGAITASAALAALSGVPTTRTISVGTGLTGGGDLSADRTISISSISSDQIQSLAGLTSGQYGSASSVAQVTVNSKGQTTLASNVAIAIGTNQVTGLSATALGAITQLSGDVTTGTGGGSQAATLASVVGLSSGQYGSATSVAQVTINQKGLTTLASSVPIAITTAQVTGLNADAVGALPLTGGTVTGPTVIEVTSSSPALRITQQTAGTGNALVVEDANNPDTTPFVIDASGNVVRGNTATAATVSLTGAAITPAIQNTSTSQAGSSLGVFSWSTSTGGPCVVSSKSKSGTIGTHTAVVTGDDLGSVVFAGSDGTAFQSSSYILGEAEGTIASGSVPGRMVFATTPTSGTVPTERLRLSSDGTSQFTGRVGVNTAADATAAIKVDGGGINFNGTGTLTTLAASGDLTGTLPSPTVAKIQGSAVSSTAPTSGQVLSWNSGTSQWEPTTASGTGTVTSITAGTGLTGGTITTSGTVAADFGSVAGKVTEGGTTVLKAGDTMTGKLILGAGGTTAPVNLGASTAPVSPVGGDLWLSSGNVLSYRGYNNATYPLVSTAVLPSFTAGVSTAIGSAAVAALAVQQNGAAATMTVANTASATNDCVTITNLGSGNSLVVNDETTPDSTRFAVANNGRVGIGVAPDASIALTLDTSGMRLGGAAGPTITSGTGSPEGVVTAPIGSLFLNLSGGASTTLYVKTSGAGNTGWTAK